MNTGQLGEPSFENLAVNSSKSPYCQKLNSVWANTMYSKMDSRKLKQEIASVSRGHAVEEIWQKTQNSSVFNSIAENHRPEFKESKCSNLDAVDEYKLTDSLETLRTQMNHRLN